MQWLLLYMAWGTALHLFFWLVAKDSVKLAIRLTREKEALVCKSTNQNLQENVARSC